ncbi:hypothetical protein [Luedemannella flava]|uniref:hypothetical protein n=1 Tax=Luedemannella flava TaxID=349316 RepID=UPI0031DE277F
MEGASFGHEGGRELDGSASPDALFYDPVHEVLVAYDEFDEWLTTAVDIVPLLLLEHADRQFQRNRRALRRYGRSPGRSVAGDRKDLEEHASHAFGRLLAPARPRSFRAACVDRPHNPRTDPARSAAQDPVEVLSARLARRLARWAVGARGPMTFRRFLRALVRQLAILLSRMLPSRQRHRPERQPDALTHQHTVDQYRPRGPSRARNRLPVLTFRELLPA